MLRSLSLPEYLLVTLGIFWFYKASENFWLTLAQVAAALFVARVFAALADIGTARYELRERGQKIWSGIFYGSALALALHFVQWKQLAQQQIQWPTIWSNALACIGFGVFYVGSGWAGYVVARLCV